jgi:hypothetical protein
MIRFLAPFALLLSTACIQLGGEAQPTRYYLLAPLATTAVIENAAEVQLEMDALEFPSYLDRAQLVSRTPQGTIQIAEYDRWAEPLADNLSRTLQENLYQLAPGVQVNSALWNNGPPAKLLLRLRVNRFDGTLGHETEVDIRWSLYQQQQQRELLREHFIARLPVGNSYKELVESLNRALANLSEEIARALVTAQ